MAKKRICVGSMFTETSHFLSTRSDLEHWRNTYVLEDDDIFALVSSRSEEGGMLARLSRAGVEVVPTLAARAISGGRSTSDCYEYIRNGIVCRIKASMPVDGVLLSLHGAMTAESEDDPEGRLLRDIRGLVGDGVPIVASLDMHAHVTEQMIQNADALVAFRNYPHDDTYETGIRAAEMLLEILSGELKPCMVVAKVPMLFSGVNGMTFGDAPMAQLRKMAIELENQHFVRSASVIHVQPTNDLPDMGCGALIVCNDIEKIQLAVAAAGRLAMEMWDRRQLFEPDTSNVDDAVLRGLKIEGGPIILVDTADCAGGGAAGDSNDVLERLIALKPAGRSLTMVVDPAAAIEAARAGVGAYVSLKVGYGVDPTWGKPIVVTGKVKTITDGNFLFSGGAFGNTIGRMGLSAVVEIEGISLLIMSKPTYDWRDEQYRAAGCDPKEFKFVVAKNPVNFRYAYADIAKEYILLDTLGPTPPSMKNLPYKVMKRPFFPLDTDIPNLRPTIYTNGGRSFHTRV